MKTLFRTVVAMMSVVAYLSGCGLGQTKTETETTDSLSTESISDSLAFHQVVYTDSLSKGEYVNITQNIQIDWPNPADESLLADSIRHWIASLVESSSFPYAFDADDKEKLIYGGDIHEGQSLVDFFGKYGMEKMMSEVAAAEADSLPIFGMSNDLKVIQLYHTDKYITMTVGYYVFLGGAHGGFSCSGSVFRKSDGHEMGWDIIDLTKKSQLIALIQKGLLSYFSVNDENELFESLLLLDDPDTAQDESAELPLPAMAPYFTPEGVCFVYQQYEIAPYAAGLPTVVIPFEQMRPLLSNDGLSLLD